MIMMIPPLSPITKTTKSSTRFFTPEKIIPVVSVETIKRRVGPCTRSKNIENKDNREARNLFICFCKTDEVVDQQTSGEDQGLVSRNVWDYKPWWCKPYSIVTTGVLGVAFMYKLTNGSVIISGIVTALVSIWWYTFLIVYPSQFELYLMEQEELSDKSDILM